MNLYYTKNRESQNEQSVNTKSIGFTASSSVWEIYHDYREYTVMDRVIEALLNYRNIWKRVKDPWNYDCMNFSFVGTDISILPKYMSTLKYVDADGNVEKTIVVRMKEYFEQNEYDIIKQYEKQMKDLRSIKLTKDNFNNLKGTSRNKLILKNSQIGNRIAQITRLSGDKSSLYSLLKSYGGGKFIPKNFEIDIDKIQIELKKSNPDLDDRTFSNVFKEYLYNFLSSELETDKIWVIKPTYGSRGVGMYFANTEEFLLNFMTWFFSKYVVKKKDVKFSKWLVSEFKMSFKWKLDVFPDSLKLLNWQYIGNNGKVINGKLDKKPKEFKDEKVGLYNKCNVIKVFDKDSDETSTMSFIDKETSKRWYYIKTKNPKESEEFVRHRFDNEQNGRINKARIWFAIDLSDNKYKIHVYDKLLFELCSKEYIKENDYKDKEKTWTDVNEKLYNEQYGLDDVNSSRASELDLCFVVDWYTGRWGRGNKKFPKDWGKIKNNFVDFFNKFKNATKDRVQCISSSRSIDDSNFKTKGCFQYFGMDFIVDNDCNIWLLEFNTRPWVGYGNWWKNFFDPDNIHIPHKWIFIESIIRKFIDGKFDKKPTKLPYNEYDFSKCWDCVTEHYYSEIKHPLAIMPRVMPKEGDSNWMVHNQTLNVLNYRGYSVFPYSNLVGKPEFTMQGMTLYINFLIKNSNGNFDQVSEFIRKMSDMYPDLMKTKTMNRIFSFVYYLGNKVVLTNLLKNTNFEGIDRYAKQKLKPFRILPASYTINIKRNPNWKNELYKTILESEKENFSGKIKRWIAKPALGKQGTGIYISDTNKIKNDKRFDLSELFENMENDEDNKDEEEWVVSWYIDNPLLFYDRKSHIRVFTLVVNDGNGNLKYYIMNVPLLFLAGMPYNKERSEEFYNVFFSDRGIEIARREANLKNNDSVIETLSRYKNLTNLSKGKDFFMTYVKKPDGTGNYFKGIDNVEYSKPTEVEERLSKKDTWFKGSEEDEDFGYKVLSYDARLVYNRLVKREKGKGKKYPRYDEEGGLGDKIKDLLIHTLYSTKDFSNCFNKGSCYHYLAFDIMVDEDHHPWLLEVNVNPGLKAIQNVLKFENRGGLVGFLHNIFNKTISLDNLFIYEKIVEETKELKNVYKKDTLVWEKIENDKKKYTTEELQSVVEKDAVEDDELYVVNKKTLWVQKLYKSGDPIKYSYSRDNEGIYYTDKGDLDTVLNFSRKTFPRAGWDKGDFYINDSMSKRSSRRTSKRSSRKYYVSDGSRGDLKKLQRVRENLFDEIMRISPKKKSMSFLDSTMDKSTKSIPEGTPESTLNESKAESNEQKLEESKITSDQKVENPMDEYFLEILRRAGMVVVKKDGKDILIPPKIAKVLAVSKLIKKDSPKMDTIEDDMKDYFRILFREMMSRKLFGNRNMELFRPAEQVIPTYLSTVFRGFHSGNYSRSLNKNLYEHLVDLYMYNQIFKTEDKDGNLINFIFPFWGLLDEKSSFGNYVNVMGMSQPVRDSKVLVALADSGLLDWGNTPRGSTRSLLRSIFGTNKYGTPKLPSPDIECIEKCFSKKLKRAPRSKKSMCDKDSEEAIKYCNMDEIARIMRRRGIPSDLVDKSKRTSKASMLCVLGCYVSSGLINMDVLGDENPENNLFLLAMFNSMMNSGIQSNPFGYLKDVLKDQITRNQYAMLMELLNDKTGSDYYGINTTSGFYSAFRRMYEQKMLEGILSE